MGAIIDNIAISLVLGVLGIAVTVFTVIYSFMESAKERRRTLSDKIKNSREMDPVMESDLRFAIKYLHELKRMNMVVFAIVCCDVVTFVAYVIHMIFERIEWLSVLSLILLVILSILCFVALVIYLIQYFNRFKVL